MKTILKLLLLSLFFVSCGQYLNKKTKFVPQPVECRIIGVDDLYFEDTIRYSNISYPRRICIYGILVNKSYYDAYIPLKDHFSSEPLSEIVVKLNNQPIYSYTKLRHNLKETNFILNPYDTIPIQIVINEDNIIKGGMSRFARPQKILSKMKLSYKKNFADTVHSNLIISDINFVFDENILYQYRDTASYNNSCTLFTF